jgi:2-dehydro-3-deoxyglucarate aldolase/4-hydroxy-2-oxoheptanedioate aldolase
MNTDALDKVAIGTLVSVNSSEVAEVLSGSGLDWLFFDMEHSALSWSAVQTMIAAMAAPCRSYIRLEESTELSIKHAADTGCDGLILPQVNSPELAERIVAAACYPPFGRRSVGLGRAVDYGVTLAGAIAAGKRPELHVQIEHKDAIACLDDIASVECIDGLFVGPYDLSASYGMPGDLSNPQVQDAIAVVLDCAVRHKLVPGIFAGSNEAALKYANLGFSFIAVGADLMRLRSTAVETLGYIRGATN